jgi:hypothetical protein
VLVIAVSTAVQTLLAMGDARFRKSVSPMGTGDARFRKSVSPLGVSPLDASAHSAVAVSLTTS